MVVKKSTAKTKKAAPKTKKVAEKKEAPKTAEAKITEDNSKAVIQDVQKKNETVEVGASSVEGVNEEKVKKAPESLLDQVANEEDGKIGDVRFDNKLPENTGKSVAKRKSLLDEAKEEGRLAGIENPNDVVITNRYADKTFVATDIFMVDGDVRTPLAWEPKETKNLTALGFEREDLKNSTKLINFLAAGILVEGRLEEHQFVRSSYFKNDIRNSVLNTNLREGVTHTLEVNDDNHYKRKYREILVKEKERNDAVGIRDELEEFDNQ